MVEKTAKKTECAPTKHDFRAIVGSFYPGAHTLGGLGQANYTPTKIYCRKCGKVIAI